MASKDAHSELRDYLAPIVDLERTAAVLRWDQRTYMPSLGASARANQIATLARLKHELATGRSLHGASNGIVELVRSVAEHAR